MTGRDFRRILLIRRKALGDALVTLPAVLEVARAWPRARIDLVIDRPFAPLVAGMSPEVRVVPWPPPRGESWLRRLRAGRYDLVIDWLGNPRTALWTLLTGAPVRVGYDLPRRRWAYNVKVPRNSEDGVHLRGFAGEAFLDPLRALGLDPLPWRDGYAAAALGQDARVAPEVAQWLHTWQGRPGVPVALVMSATWPAKKWPARHVAGLVDELPRRGANPVLITGPGDDWLVADLPAALRERVVPPPTTLPELARILGASRLFVGTDCGPRHLAAALGLPTVTLFGPTDPGGWNPPGPAHVSVRMDVPCAPCNLTICPVAGHPCLDDLAPGVVAERVEQALHRLDEGARHET